MFNHKLNLFHNRSIGKPGFSPVQYKNMPKKTKAGLLAGSLSASPSAVFAAYIARVAPRSVAFASGEDWAIGGALAGRLEVPEIWVHCASWQRFPALLAALESHLDGQFSVALVNRPEGEVPPNLSWDCHLLGTRFIGKLGPRELEIRAFDLDLLRTAAIHPELKPILGRPEDLLADFGALDRFHGAFIAGRLVAVAEANVTAGQYVAIQQVYTASDFRGRGIAKALIAKINDANISRGAKSVYVCDSENTASLALAKSLGFEEVLLAPNVKRYI